MRIPLFFLPAIILLFSQPAIAQSRLLTGIWRGTLRSRSGNIVPFNFDIRNAGNRQQLFIHNGGERFSVTDIRQEGDSVFIRMPFFNSEFRLKRRGKELNGSWIKHYGDHDGVMPFTATAGIPWRFVAMPHAAKSNVTGRWTAVFVDSRKSDTTVGEFKQEGNRVTGTFLTTTGDDRFLEGTVDGNRLYLSTFDGGHAYLFVADVNDRDHLLHGRYYAGYAGEEEWSAYRNPQAKLPDAYSLTYLKPGFQRIAFSFPDLKGKRVSLSDPQYHNKVVIVQMLGSWCPNCMDETNYLVNDFYPKYRDKGVEIIGLAYERTPDSSKSRAALLQLKNRFNIPYPLLLTGYTPKEGDPIKSLPALGDFKGFPTTIIIDRKGNVRKIHTGFSGPGTGPYYRQFVSEFEKLIDQLLSE